VTEYATTEPEKITAGDYVQWKRTASGFSIPTGDVPKASDGWVLTYALVSSGKSISITAATHETDDFLVTLTASVTAAYTAGVYSWQAYLTKSSTSERYMVDSGELQVLPNFAAQTKGYDGRSYVKQVLDALEAKLLGRASKDQEAMVVGGEIIKMIPLTEIVRLRDQFKMAYENEQAAERIANGLGTGKQVLVRFIDD
jgi:hypothetical protein